MKCFTCSKDAQVMISGRDYSNHHRLHFFACRDCALGIHEHIDEDEAKLLLKKKRLIK